MRKLLATACLTATFVTGAVLSPLAQADPPPQPCVTPDGGPCAPASPGCVRPDNALPCSSSLPDINAAIRQELQQILGGALSAPR